MSDAPKRPTPEQVEEIRGLLADGWSSYTAQKMLLAEIDALRSQVATLTVERDEAQDRLILSEARQLKANDERDSAIADCKALAAECRCSRQYDNLLHTCDRDPTRPCRACEAAQALEAARVATNASGALARHGGGA